MTFFGERMMSHSKLFTFSDCLAKHHRNGRTQVAYVTQALEEQIYEPRHEISNNVVCATSKGSDQPVHTRTCAV